MQNGMRSPTYSLKARQTKGGLRALPTVPKARSPYPFAPIDPFPSNHGSLPRRQRAPHARLTLAAPRSHARTHPCVAARLAWGGAPPCPAPTARAPRACSQCRARSARAPAARTRA
eukprot:5348041-Pleurochrysis_carterae.AAC.3